MRRLLITGLALAAVGLSGCGPSEPITGVVTGHDEATDTYYQTCQQVKNTRICQQHTIPGCLELEVTSADGTEHEFCVDKSEWDSYADGDAYPRPAPGAST